MTPLPPRQGNGSPHCAPDDTIWQALTNATRDAGAVSLSYFGRTVKTWNKDDATPVSDADLAVDALLKDRLLTACPDYGWLSEETEDDPDRLGKDYIWVVDPIDGTRAFLRGEPDFCISVALVAAGRPIAAAIFNPATDEFFEARIGLGATLNGKSISVSLQADLEDCRMLAEPRQFKHPAWPEPWPEMNIRYPNSIAYRLALVASGQWDAAVSFTWKYDWDLAAADLIVAEARGRMTRHDGARLLYNRESPAHRSLICAGPPLHEKILQRIGHLRLP